MPCWHWVAIPAMKLTGWTVRCQPNLPHRVILKIKAEGRTRHMPLSFLEAGCNKRQLQQNVAVWSAPVPGSSQLAMASSRKLHFSSASFFCSPTPPTGNQQWSLTVLTLLGNSGELLSFKVLLSKDLQYCSFARLGEPPALPIAFSCALIVLFLVTYRSIFGEWIDKVSPRFSSSGPTCLLKSAPCGPKTESTQSLDHCLTASKEDSEFFSLGNGD